MSKSPVIYVQDRSDEGNRARVNLECYEKQYAYRCNDVENIPGSQINVVRRGCFWIQLFTLSILNSESLQDICYLQSLRK